MSKKKAKKRHAKKSKSKPLRKKASSKVRRTNKVKTVKRNSKRKTRKKSIAKTRLVSKRVKKHGRKRINSSRKPAKKGRTKRANKRTNRTVKKTTVTTRRKRTSAKTKKLSKLSIHENFKKDENGKPTEELNNILTIEFDKSLSFKDKIFIIQNHPLDAINLMIQRHRLLPRSYMVILQTEHPTEPSEEPYERANRISDPTVNPEIPVIRQSIIELMMAFQDNYFEYIFESENPLESDWVYDPSNITAIHIRFFYAG